MRTPYEYSVKPSIPLEIVIGTKDAESSLDTFEQRSARFISAATILVGPVIGAYGVPCTDKITFLVNYLDSFFQALRAFKSTAADTH